MEKSSKTPQIVAVVVAIAVLGGGALLLTSNKDDAKSDTTKTTETSQQTTQQDAPKKATTIVDLAVATPDLSTLVTAVTAADLGTTLSDTTKQYTVFAPTNAAFAKLPSGTLETLLKPENKPTLSSILTYHVVSGAVYAKDLSNGQVVTTVNGAKLTVEIMDGKVSLIDAKGGKSTVTSADIKADNGVVHVIDSVLLPS